MVVGIVTETKPETKVPILRRIFRIYGIAEIKNSQNPFDAVVAILPYSKKQIERMSEKGLEKSISRAVRYLKKNGAEKTTVSLYLKKTAAEKKVYIKCDNSDGANALFLKMSPQILREYASKNKINLLSSSICISSIKMDRISEYITDRLCYDTKDITIITTNIKKAREFADSFFDETGLLISVCQSSQRQFDFVIDVDNAVVKTDVKLIAGDINLGYDFDGYEVGTLDVAAVLNTTQTEKLLDFFHGKKRLTL